MKNFPDGNGFYVILPIKTTTSVYSKVPTKEEEKTKRKKGRIDQTNLEGDNRISSACEML
jgi:hypothetical protein